VFYTCTRYHSTQSTNYQFNSQTHKGKHNMKLKVIIHPAEEGGFWAEVPPIQQGCATQGENF
jgi:hypothetical protein